MLSIDLSLNNPVELAAKLANGDPDPRVLRWAEEGFAVFFRHGGMIPLERCLCLPGAQGLRLAQRNIWLVQAAKLLPNVHSLAHEYDTFLSSGPWRAWRGLSAAPDGTSKLRIALFHAAKANNGKSLSVKQIRRIVGHKYTQQCPRQNFIIQA